MLTLVFTTLAIYFGEFREYYEKYWWWDLFLHFVAGFIISYETRKHLLKENVNLIIVFSLTVCMLTLWEVFEFSMDVFFYFNMQKNSLIDTMEDLIIGIVGSLIYILINYKTNTNNIKTNTNNTKY